MTFAIRPPALQGYLLACVLMAGGCAQKGPGDALSPERVSPVPLEIRDRVDSVVVQVAANSEFQLDLGDTLETSAESRTNEGVKASTKGGVGTMAVGCHPQWNVFWVFTCPAGLVVGMGVMAAGSLTSAVVGHGTAWSEEDIAAANAAFAEIQLRDKLANEFRGHLVAKLEDNETVQIALHEGDGTGLAKPFERDPSRFVLAVDVEHFFISEVGEVSPDLWVDLEVSGAIYEFPDPAALYQRRWRLYSEMGDYNNLVSGGALALQSKLSAALDEMARTISDDLFPDGHVEVPGEKGEFAGEVATLYVLTSGSASTAPLPSGDMLSSYRRYLDERGIVIASASQTAEDQGPKPLRVGLFPAAFFSPTLPSTTVNELSVNTALQIFVDSSAALEMSFDYSKDSTKAKYTYGKIWTGSAVKKDPRVPGVRRAARLMDLDVVVMYWIKNVWAQNNMDIYVYDVAADRMHRESGLQKDKERLISQAFAAVDPRKVPLWKRPASD